MSLIRQTELNKSLSDPIVEVNNNGTWYVLYYSQLESCGVDNICDENEHSDDLRKELKEFWSKKNHRVMCVDCKTMFYHKNPSGAINDKCPNCSSKNIGEFKHSFKKKKEVKIQIVGEVGTGKIAIAQIIKNELNKHNVEVSMDDVDDVELTHDPYGCLRSFKGNLKVDIEILHNKLDSAPTLIGHKGPGIGCWSHHSVENGELQIIDEITPYKQGLLARSEGINIYSNPYDHSTNEWVWWNRGWRKYV